MKALMLHDVRTFDKNFFPQRYAQHSFLTQTQFLNGLKSLNKNLIEPTFLEESDRPHHENEVLLTFDDGLKDHLKVAEILAEKGKRAVFFIPFGIVQSGEFIASHLIQFLIAGADLTKLSAWIANELIKLGCSLDYINEFAVSKWKNNLWDRDQVFVTRVLREFGDSEKRNKLLLSALATFFSYDLRALHENLYLTFADVVEINRMGHTIGSHGWLSCDLRYVESDIIERELVAPLDALKGISDKNPWMSFANGGSSEVIERELRKAGYTCAFGTEHKSISNFSLERFNLPRLDGTKLGEFCE
jgi:peptidoglycan/xylan/chitin deacetylase (PgdA/CDA1 family)